ncbi:MAG: tetratricopeptide repeat protein [Methylacidiphilales bacterium]|nr:tetratricopeptide repeat protein [Candidatus Methylacidiphilales bacterium]
MFSFRPISILPRLLLFAVLVASTLSVLRAEPSDDEKKALKTAQQSYKDGAFDLCNDRVATLLKKYPKTELAPQAELLQARALYQLGRSNDALAALNLPPDQMPANLQADTLFWQGEVLLNLGKWPDAEQKYRALLTLKDTAGHAEEANLGLAWALFKQGRESEAAPLIDALIKQTTNPTASQQAQLLLAKIEMAKRQMKEAIAGLEGLLASQPNAGLMFETNYWLGEAYSANGHADKAIAAYETITGDLQSPDKPPAFPKSLVAQAYLGLGRALHTLHQDDQAMLAYQQTYQMAENETTRLDAFRAYLECARADGQLPEAVTTLQEFAKTSDASAPAALFAIGSVLAEDGENDKAIGMLESLLVAYPNSPWVPTANYQLGQLYAKTGKPDQAIKALQNCIAANSDPALVRNARSQLGYVYLHQTKDYANAITQFSLLADGTDTSAENASYNLLLAEAGLAKTDALLKGVTDFEKRFPSSSHLKQIALVEGQLLTALNRVSDAEAVYQKAIALGGKDPEQTQLLQALAELQYQNNDLEGALATYQATVNQFPNDSLLAAQRGILVSYELKKLTDDQVEQALVKLAQNYANVPGAPEAYFRLGEFYFFRQDYVKAQDAFQQLTTNYPNSDYTDEAYFYAGRAAFAHQDYAAARTLLEKVPDTSPFKADARLWEGRVSQEQHHFDEAAALFDAVLATDKTGPRFVQASLLKGECLFELGTQDPANYPKAQATFDQILQNKEGTIAERNEAAVRSAKCLEKMGKAEEAMALYLDVLYGRVAGDDSSSPVPPDFSWQIKAGWEAGRIREAQKDWRGAIEIYQRLEQIGGAHQQEFHDLINKLRRDNYIYE